MGPPLTGHQGCTPCTLMWTFRSGMQLFKDPGCRNLDMYIVFSETSSPAMMPHRSGLLLSVQVNGRVGRDGGLLGAGVLTQHVWVMADDSGIKCGWKGRDQGLGQTGPPLTPGVNASCSELAAIVSSQNAKILLNIIPSSAAGVYIEVHDRCAPLAQPPQLNNGIPPCKHGHKLKKACMHKCADLPDPWACLGACISFQW